MNENAIRPIDPPEMIRELADHVGGTINECAALPDGSGFATMSMPLPKSHWLYVDDGQYEAPPMTLRDAWVHADPPYRETMRHALAEKIRAAGRYAVRSATMKGKENDFDPDALVQNLVVGMLGYFTPNGLTDDEWANPPHLRGESAKSANAVDPHVANDDGPVHARQEGREGGAMTSAPKPKVPTSDEIAAIRARAHNRYGGEGYKDIQTLLAAVDQQAATIRTLREMASKLENYEDWQASNMGTDMIDVIDAALAASADAQDA